VAGFVYPLVFLVPILALLGFVEAGKEALALLNGGDQDWAQANADATVRFAAISPRLLLIQDIFLAVYAAAVVSAIAPFIARARRQRWATALIEYVEGPTVRASLGLTILEVSRANDLPHASACAGHGRCATCRVRVVAGMHNLSPPKILETELLNRTALDADVRLACQALLIGPNITVQRLVPADEEEEAARDPLGWQFAACQLPPRSVPHERAPKRCRAAVRAGDAARTAEFVDHPARLNTWRNIASRRSAIGGRASLHRRCRGSIKLASARYQRSERRA
jgi:adenylate cyclase